MSRHLTKPSMKHILFKSSGNLEVGTGKKKICEKNGNQRENREENGVKERGKLTQSKKNVNKEGRGHLGQPSYLE